MTPHQATPSAWEAIALSVLIERGSPPAPIDSLRLALQIGLRLAPTPAPTAMLAGNAVMVSPALSEKALRWHAAHEIGHWALIRAGYADPEDAADRVAEALLLPAYDFDPDAHGWNVQTLQRQHRFVSLETIARRIASTKEACVTVWSGRRAVRRICRSRYSAPPSKPSAPERVLASAARSLGGLVSAGPRMFGFVDDDEPTRIVTLCGLSELHRRAFLASAASR